ncbi:hypothetical protein ACP70R_023404 [Stipagrostis hirtigluma subsp. patula]
MSRLARSARRASAAALAILLGGLVLVSLTVETSVKESSPVIVAAVDSSRRMMVGANGGLPDQRTLEGFRDDDPFSSSKRKVPNGPDPIHNSSPDMPFHRSPKNLSTTNVVKAERNDGSWRVREITRPNLDGACRPMNGEFPKHCESDHCVARRSQELHLWWIWPGCWCN